MIMNKQLRALWFFLLAAAVFLWTSAEPHTDSLSEKLMQEPLYDSILPAAPVSGPLQPQGPQPALSQPSPRANSNLLGGIGFGFTIGNVPLFNTWKNSLPDSLRHVGLDPGFGKILPDSVNSISADTMGLIYIISERPEIYNMTVPVYLSVQRIKEDELTSLGLSFFHTSKQFQSMVFPGRDTLGRRVNIHEKLSFYSLALEVGYQKVIPDQYFKIEGVDKTYFTAALSASPLSAFSKKASVTTSVPAGDIRMHTAADIIKTHLTTLSSNGVALSWRLGISTMKRNPLGGGMDLGVHYSGSWYTLFTHNGFPTLNKHIHTQAPKPDRPLSFLSNRIEFRVSFLRAIGKNHSTLPAQSE